MIVKYRHSLCATFVVALQGFYFLDECAHALKRLLLTVFDNAEHRQKKTNITFFVHAQGLLLSSHLGRSVCRWENCDSCFSLL